MNNKFSDFTINEQQNNNTNSNTYNNQTSRSNMNNVDNDNNPNNKNSNISSQMQQMFDKYSSLDTNQLLSEFQKLSKQKKNNGELESNQISNMKNILQNYLSKEQLDVFDNLLGDI